MSEIKGTAQVANAKLGRNTRQRNVDDMQAAIASAFTVTTHNLKRDGLTALVFDGSLLVETTSYAPGTSIWYEIAAFSAKSGEYIASIKVFRKAEHAKDSAMAVALPSRDALVLHLENYDPATDVLVDLDAGDKTLSTAELTLKAVSLRQKIDEARLEYRSAVSELLHQLLA
jgi:hypothetical protein